MMMYRHVVSDADGRTKENRSLSLSRHDRRSQTDRLATALIVSLQIRFTRLTRFRTRVLKRENWEGFRSGFKLSEVGRDLAGALLRNNLKHVSLAPLRLSPSTRAGTDHPRIRPRPGDTGVKWSHHGAKRAPLVVKSFNCLCKGRVKAERAR